MQEGSPLSKMYVVRVGEVTCTSKGKVLPMQEAGGFSRFGEQNLVVRSLQLMTNVALSGQAGPACQAEAPELQPCLSGCSGALCHTSGRLLPGGQASWQLCPALVVPWLPNAPDL